MPDLSSTIAKQIVARIRTKESMDVRNASIVESVQEPQPGIREFTFQCARPTVTPGGMSGGAYRQVVNVSMGLFIDAPVDAPREVEGVQDRLGTKAELIRTHLEGFDCGELNVPLFGDSGPGEIRHFVPVSQDGSVGLGLFSVEWSMRGEKWAKLIEFQSEVNQGV